MSGDRADTTPDPRDRIVFAGNPWPEGHAIRAFAWTARVVDGDVRFYFHLESAQYYAERDIVEDEEDDRGDWLSPGVWSNYHRCTLSSTKWGNEGFVVGPAATYCADDLDGRVFRVDPLPLPDDIDHDALAFGLYLLGHDMAVDHTITFRRVPGTDTFDIDWRGRIALTYAGDYEPRHAFHAVLHGVAAPASIG